MPSNPDFDPVTSAKLLLRTSRSGALATLQADSRNPFCSLVNIASMPDGSPILLISQLAVHTKNILADANISLLLSERDAADPLMAPRISITGRAEPIVGANQQTARRRYLAAHPAAEVFVNFTDFSFYRVVIEQVHLVAGFGRIVDIRGDSVLTVVSDAGVLLASEQDAVTHMNQDHLETLGLYATRLLGAVAADWRCVGIDPDGLDMQATDGRVLRLGFPQRIVAADALRGLLKELANQARTPNSKPN